MKYQSASEKNSFSFYVKPPVEEKESAKCVDEAVDEVVDEVVDEAVDE